MDEKPKAESRAEEIARLQTEIGQRLVRLQYLVCGDPFHGVGQLTPAQWFADTTLRSYSLPKSGPP